MAEMKAIVSVEKAVHNAVHEMMQAIYDQHGIIVHGVNVHWLDISTHNQSKMVVAEINIDSRTKY